MRGWIYGLVAACVSAAADAGVTLLGGVMFAPGLLQDRDFWMVLGGTIGFSALKTAFAYLKQSPLPAMIASPKTSTQETVAP